jgi:molybdopterin-containing oxidoreductase family iron-sulfur binding subunit
MREPKRDFVMSRRASIKVGGMVVGGLAHACLSGCSFEEYFQGRFRRMTADEVSETIARLERKYSAEYGVDFRLEATPARDGVVFGSALDISRCIGCRRCVYACVRENNQTRDVQLHWIRVLRMKRGDFDLERGDHYYDPELVPEDGFFYLPVQCQQCEDPPCVRSCPVEATWQEPDGTVVIDYNWCIGCRTCMAACPYGARHFNWNDPVLEREEINPEVHYLGNRPRMRGVVEKCTHCIQGTRKGRYPACVEACPVGARKFGNLLDPDSEIRYVLDNFNVFRLKEELNTAPRFWYFATRGW